jgi:DNA invertase Pin-like site-specific DNA recombinase
VTAEPYLRLVQDDDASEWEDIGYTRISDDRTGVAASPARQRRAITAEAAAEGRAITHWFEDLSKSAYKAGVVRPQFDAMLDACQQHPVRRLWVLHDDRLIREGDEDDLPRLIRALAPAKIIIRCIEASDLKLWQAEGKMSARVRNAVNGYESERKKERVMIATEDRARKGRFPGGQRRFGYRQRDTRIVRRQDDDGVITEIERPSGPLVLVPDEAQAIADGYKMIMSGATLYAVTKDWQGRGLTGPTGAQFTPVAVREVLLREANAGLSAHKGQIVGTGDWPAITDPDTYATARAILTDPSRRRGPGKPAGTLLAGVLKCDRCQQPVSGAAREPGPDGKRRLVYRCRHSHVSRDRATLDGAVSELVVAHLEASASTLARPRKAASRAVARAISEAEKLRGQIEGYQARASEFDPADLAGILRGLRARLAKAEASMVKEAGRPASHALVASGDIRAAWLKAGIADRRTVIREQVAEIMVGPARGGGRDPMRNVQITWTDQP